jgi:hypothetical protein
MKEGTATVRRVQRPISGRAGQMLVPCLASSVIVVLCVTPASAEAARFTGETNQGARVSMTTNASGVPTRIDVSRYRADCRDDDKFYAEREGSGYRAPFDRSSADAVRDRDTARIAPEGYGGRVAFELDLRRRPDGSWRAKDVRRIRLEPESGGDTLRCRAVLRYTLRD